MKYHEHLVFLELNKTSEIDEKTLKSWNLISSIVLYTEISLVLISLIWLTYKVCDIIINLIKNSNKTDAE
jgi:hypothetical protein